MKLSTKKSGIEIEQYCQQYLVDLAAERVGGETLSCSDDFFAPMENLLKPGRGIFIEDKYTDQGKWMDGWESRRSYGRDNGRDHDYCIIHLGIPGIIRVVDVDTNHFRGNAPVSVSIEASHCPKDTVPDEIQWHEILPQTDVKAHSQNLINVDNTEVWNHIRFNIYPDGGVARLRVYGEPVIDLAPYAEATDFDLAAITHGARALRCSDMFFSDKNNLIMPGRGVNMGDGWETKRRRDPGPDWLIIKLAASGCIHDVLLDTAHFKGNFPDHFSLEATLAEDKSVLENRCQWQTILIDEKLAADQEHHYHLSKPQVCSHVRLNIYPDGGVSRLRLFGKISTTEAE